MVSNIPKYRYFTCHQNVQCQFELRNMYFDSNNVPSYYGYVLQWDDSNVQISIIATLASNTVQELSCPNSQ
jgi:hypothetical protein